MSAHRGEDAPTDSPSPRASQDAVLGHLPQGLADPEPGALPSPPVPVVPPARFAEVGTVAIPAPEVLPNAPWDEPSSFLAELDRIEAELRGQMAPAEPSASGSASATAGPEPWDEDGADPEPLSPYLEQRLRVASVEMEALGSELRALEGRWHELRGSAERLERELREAVGEAGFLREGAPAGDDLGASTAGTGPVSATGPAASARAAALLPRTPPYVEFTAARYNRTIGGLKARRVRLALWTAVLAVLISGALVTLAVLAREGAPPIWLEVLPLIWLVPVPFFLVSFLSTQRVLKRNHLDVARVS